MGGEMLKKQSIIKNSKLEMGYIMEMSFNILKHGNVSELKAHVMSLAQEYQCESFHDYIEMGSGCGGRLFEECIQRNHCIMVSEFNEDDVEFIASFIHIIQRIKGVYLECIYQDDVKCKLIYASPFYLKLMTREKVEMYKKYVQEKIYTKHEALLLQEVGSKHRRAMTV